jgi:nucleoside-diphosphate-sugar epimerase
VSGLTLITGGAGFIGTNTADRLLRAGRRVRVLDDLSRDGVERNLEWLERTHGNLLEVEIGDVGDHGIARRAVRGASAIYHFAAQVAVTTSFDDPLGDAATNLHGTLAMLEAARLPTRCTAVWRTSHWPGSESGISPRTLRCTPASPNAGHWLSVPHTAARRELPTSTSPTTLTASAWRLSPSA